MLFQRHFERGIPPRDRIAWAAFLPTFGQLKILNGRRSIGGIDVLKATILLSPLIEPIWVDGSADLVRNGGYNIGQDTMAQLVIYHGQRCASALDSTIRSLIISMTFVAPALEIKAGRANRRKTRPLTNGAIDPAMGIRYEIFRRIPQNKIIGRLRSAKTPLFGLADTIGNTPCAFIGPDGPTHDTFMRANRTLTLTSAGPIPNAFRTGGRPQCDSELMAITITCMCIMGLSTYLERVRLSAPFLSGMTRT